MRYIRRPTYVEAIQWTGSNQEELRRLCEGTSCEITTTKYGTGVEMGCAWHALCDKQWVVVEGDTVRLYWNADFRKEFVI